MDYTLKVPPYDTQYCATTHSDVQDCTVESLAHIYYMLTGIRVSPRAWAVAAHLEISANRNVEHVLSVVNQIGYVLWDDCPTPDTFTMDSYYQPLTTAESKWHPVKIQLEPFDLNISPGWTEIAWGLNLPIPTRHMVAQINETQYFDSEAGAPIKPLNYGSAQIVYQTSIKIINPQQTAMLKVTVNSDGKTINLEGELGKIALEDEASLTLLRSLTADQPEPTGNVPQVGILGQGFNIHK